MHLVCGIRMCKKITKQRVVEMVQPFRRQGMANEFRFGSRGDNA
jgi:hypothetical protein